MPSLSLASVLDLSASANLRAQILEHRGQDLDLDASNVERLGGLCLQVLLSAQQTWTADQKTLRLVNISRTCRDSLSLAQASAAFGLEE